MSEDGYSNAIFLTNSQIAVLIECWNQVCSAESLEKVYELLVLNARKLAAAKHATLNLLEDGNLHCVGSTLEEYIGKIRQLDPSKKHMEVIGRVLEDGIGKILNNFELKDDLKVCAMACVPLKLRKNIIGTMQVYGTGESIGFTDNDLHALQILADHSAVIIERLKLQNQILLESGRIQGIFQALTDGIMLVNNDGVPVLYNQAVETMFFPEGKDNYAFAAYLDNVVKTDEMSGSSEVVLLKPHEMVLSNRFVTVRGADGDFSEKVISIRNISEQRAAERRFSQFYAMVLHRYNRILLQMWKCRRKRNGALWHRLLLKQRVAMYHLVTLTDLRSGPLRIERENCSLADIYSKVKSKFSKSFAKANINIDDIALLSVGKMSGRFDSQRITQMFYAIFRKARSAVKSGLRMLWDAAVMPDCITISTVLEGKISSEKVSAKMLDWNVQVDRILNGKTFILDLDLPLLNHIVRAHKGSVTVVNESEYVSIKVVLPVE